MMTHQRELLPVQPSPEQDARAAERAKYLERLREHLQDPNFRAIEGFPIGDAFDQIAERIRSLSAEMGTEIEQEGEHLVIEVEE